jgi:hypothetical protein
VKDDGKETSRVSGFFQGKQVTLPGGSTRTTHEFDSAREQADRNRVSVDQVLRAGQAAAERLDHHYRGND